MKKRLMIALLLCLLLLTAAAGAETLYRTLEVGSVGDDVLVLKERLRDLGYYGSVSLNGTYNDAAAGVVRQFQYNNGLLMTGKADAYTQSLLYSEGAARAAGGEAILPPEGAGGDGQYRPLTEGAYGDDVLAFKHFLYKQGYYKSNDFNNAFNAIMTQRVAQYQQDQGLPADGVVSVEMQLAALGSRTVSAGGAATEWIVETPPLNEDGFLADANAEPFVYSDFATGRWLYVDSALHIEITRYDNPKNADLSWYVTDIRMQEGETWNALMSKGSREDGHNFEDGMTIADQYNAILAVTDDNFGYRWYRRIHDKNLKYQQGVVIRDGIVRADAMPDSSYYDFPPLDVLAYYPDGHIELYYPEEHNAQDYLDMGVLHTFCFGPILLKDGQVNPRLYAPSSKTLAAEYEEQAARQAIGYYAPGHYVIVTANGNHDSRTGVKMQWMVDKMLDLGVTDAFNLDGGRTTLLYFMGQAVNKKENVNRDAMREVTGLIGFGTR